MIRHTFIFLGTFVLGAVIALAARTATHRPHAAAPANAPGAPDAPSHAAHAPAASTVPTPPTANLKSEISDPKSPTPVNTHCALCGMEVDPKLPTLTYQGKTIGFGCKICPPKFLADPDRYGPYFLRNEIIKH
jgi:hypothetical protein